MKIPLRAHRVAMALLAGGFFAMMPGCKHPPGFSSDQTLRDRFSRNRADYEELIVLFNSQSGEKITRDTDPPKWPEEQAGWKQIRDLLVKLHATSIERETGGIFIRVQDYFGWYYWFEYRTTAPPGLVQSLEKARTNPYTPMVRYTMPLDGNWYACYMEDDFP